MQKSYLTYFISLLFFVSNITLGDENAFEKNYQIQSPKGFHSFLENPDTKIMRGWEQKTDRRCLVFYVSATAIITSNDSSDYEGRSTLIN